MSRSRIIGLLAIKRKVALQKFRQEQGRLTEEIDRLGLRIDQVVALEAGYHAHLTEKSISVNELRGITALTARLGERRDIDQRRRELLDVERIRLAPILVAKRREIEKLEEEAKIAARAEAEEKAEKRLALMPARRN
jgi:hypothetical protein